jgi:glucoamylase
VLALLALAAPAAGDTAPGAPGQPAIWTEADKDGFGTATQLASEVWFTLDDGRLTEVYYPDLGTPAVRDLQFVVSDGKTFAEREQDATEQRVRLLDEKSLSYRQVNTDRSGLYRIVKTYTTDPARSTVLVHVRFESSTSRPLHLYVLHDPALSNDGDDDSGARAGGGLVAWDGQAASALLGDEDFRDTSSGYLGASDGWEDLRQDFRMDWRFDSAPTGNVVQTARTRLDGKRHRTMTLALGFGAGRGDALASARASLERGFEDASRDYARGWHRYLGSLEPMPRSAAPHGPTYWVSVMVLAASEDKANRGAGVASPSMPWAWGELTIDKPSDAYHLVWPRDLYQVATAFIAAGDRDAANRALDFTFERQQRPDGSYPQNTTVDGTPRWTNLQLDEVALPLVLAWQLGRFDAASYEHVKRSADFIAANGPSTPQERWENQSGFSPGTIAAEIAGLVCAADIARRNGDAASAQSWEAVADDWQAKVDDWTATTNGPYDPKPYYLRLTKDEQPNAGTTYSIGDGGPSAADQRAIVDPSFLELVRLGVKAPDHGPVVNTLQVVDDQLGVDTPNGRFWHRFNFDGYGETREGGPWDISAPNTFGTIGRIWPLFAGERGEYELLRGGAGPEARLAAIAGAANEGFMIPEQVWDENPPAGQPGFPRGEGSLSATPLAWSHAQYVRLAWSIERGRPVERPRIVADRYGNG